MASQHYGPTTHPTARFDHVGADRRRDVGNHAAERFAAERALARSQAPTEYDYKPPDEPAAKRRRTEETPAALRFVSQKKWVFPDAQPWMEVHSSTSSKVKSIAKMASMSDAMPQPQQLPTPQTPRFPPNPSSHGAAASGMGAEHVPQAMYSTHAGSTPAGAASAMPSFSDRSERAAAFTRPQSSSRPTQRAEPLTRGTSEHDGRLADLARPSPPPTSLPLAPDRNARSRTSHQTLSLEKDRDQIAALIAAKRKENEDNLFRQRLLQRQMEHRDQAGTKNNTLQAPDSAVSLSVSAHPPFRSSMGTDAALSQSTLPARHQPDLVQPSTQMLNRYPISTTQNQMYSMPSAQHPPSQPTRGLVEPSSKEVMRRVKSKTSPAISLPSPAPTYSTTRTGNSRDNEYQDISLKSNSPSIRLDRVPASPASEAHPPSRPAVHPYRSTERKVSQQSGSDMSGSVHQQTGQKTPTWNTVRGGGERPAQGPSSDAWDVSGGYQYMSSPGQASHLPETNFPLQQHAHAARGSTRSVTSPPGRTQLTTTTQGTGQARQGAAQGPSYLPTKPSPRGTPAGAASAPTKSQSTSSYYNVNQNYFFSPPPPPTASGTSPTTVRRGDSTGLDALAQTAATSTPADISSRSRGFTRNGTARPPQKSGQVTPSPTAMEKGAWPGPEDFKQNHWIFYPPPPVPGPQ